MKMPFDMNDDGKKKMKKYTILMYHDLFERSQR